MVSLCLECNKQPSYNSKGEKEAKYCSQHKKEGMVDVVHPKCLECDKNPCFNFPDQTKALYCKLHKKDGMKDVVHSTCKDCNRRPHFNYPDQTKPIYCATHRKKGMKNITTPTCQDDNCEKKPHFNFLGQSRGIYCFDHKQKGMVNVISRTCLECRKQPHFNFQDQRIGIYCSDHKQEGMVNVVKPTCVECNSKPHFNFPDKKTGLFCSVHKKEGMKNVVSKTCLDCDKLPCFNFPNEKNGLYCFQHKKENMKNVVNPTCKTPLCETNVTRKYNGYCFRCFMYMFPDEPVTRNYKTKEKAVSEFLKISFPDVTMVFDKKIDIGCSRKRPDCFIDMGGYTIVIEIDENQHQTYDCSCTNRRTMELFQDSGSRPLYLIRFNPDEYLDKNNQKITSCWGTTNKGICVVKKSKQNEWQFRLDCLKKFLNSCIQKAPSKEIDVLHFFYDSNTCL